MVTVTGVATMRKAIGLTVLLAMVAVLGTACNANVITGAWSPTHPRVGVLNDTSCDESPQLVREGRRALDAAVRVVAPLGGTLFADVIQQRALETNAFPVM